MNSLIADLSYTYNVSFIDVDFSETNIPNFNRAK